MRKTILYIFLLSYIAACSHIDVFEKTTFFPRHEWKTSETPSFTFDIKDTASLYNVYLVLRHDDAYRYKNIWLNVQLKSPDSTIAIKREFILADNTHWLGSSMDDIIEHRIPFNTSALFFKKGTYTFTLQQVMREDTLTHILNAGIRVEKARR
jgi:gliding motility-associated lipoprotein GldH